MQPNDPPRVSRAVTAPERPFQRPWGCLVGLAYATVVLGFAAAGNDRAVLIGVLALFAVAWVAKVAAAVRGFWRMSCWLGGLVRRTRRGDNGEL